MQPLNSYLLASALALPLLASYTYAQADTPEVVFDCSVTPSVCPNMFWGAYCSNYEVSLEFDNPSKQTKSQRRTKAGCKYDPNQCSGSANVHLDVSSKTITMEPKPGDFCVYAATSYANLPTLITSLNRGQFENPRYQTIWSPPQNPPPPDSSTGFALVAHHRQHHGILDEEYYVICDSDDWASDSGTILVVSLDFGGYVDAVRMQVSIASDSILSMGIANTYWEESLEGDRWPKEKFAVYITAKEGNVNGDALVKALNAGLAGRKAWTAGGGVCRDATALLPERGEDFDVGAVARLHGSVAEKELFDPNFFIVAEQAHWESVGVSLVRIGSQGKPDVSSKPAEYAAEILTWVDQGFCTWVEGKAWSK